MSTPSVQLPAPQFIGACRTSRDHVAGPLRVIWREIAQFSRDHISTPTPSDQALSAIDHISDLHR